ncbi:MAG: glucosaminidase domain-containing protein, partial [Propionibacteriaceae bacterium]|nr:glucosaminidase domain-containing protein [Propionibacteriaceae bacterium]
MTFFSGLSKGAAILASAAVLGSTAALAGAVLSGPARAVTIDTSSRSAFIRSIAPLAQDGQRNYNVPASVAIAQSILESGWGTSRLTQQGNAYFGIKCTTARSPFVTGCIDMRTREVFNGTPTYIIDGFRTYASATDSFMDHGRFLNINSRYRAAFNYTDDPKQFIAEVHKAGYATDPAYTAMVVKLMDDYNLYQYDKRATASPTASVTPSVTPSATPSASITP